MGEILITKVRLFTNYKGETLPLPLIIENRKIIEVTIAFELKERSARTNKFRKVIYFKKTIPKFTELLIKEEKNGIEFHNSPKNAFHKIAFSSGDEFKKLKEVASKGPITKEIVISDKNPYKLKFPKNHLITLDWE